MSRRKEITEPGVQADPKGSHDNVTTYPLVAADIIIVSGYLPTSLEKEGSSRGA